MNNVNIVIIGKTGAGKSTLVNSIIGKDVAPTGKGGKVTLNNQVYSCTKEIHVVKQGISRWNLHIYDTVGLEIDERITESTLEEVGTYLESTQKTSSDKDITIVWLCINQKSNRFENFEMTVVDEMSLKYEIPFSIILTQCISKDESDIEIQLRKEYPQINVRRVLAKSYLTRIGIFQAFGVDDALADAIDNYNETKVNVLELKLEDLDKKRKQRIEEISSRGKKCIEKKSKSAEKIGILPAGCIPFVHGICIQMLMELDRIAGIDSSHGFAADIFFNTVVGIIVTPFMIVPVLSIAVSAGYVQAIGEIYLDALLAVIGSSSDDELKNNDMMAQRIRNELEKRRK